MNSRGVADDNELFIYTIGALFFGPKGTRPDPRIARTEVISLTIFDGPLTLE